MRRIAKRLMYRMNIILGGLLALVRLERPLYRRWLAAGRHNSGYASSDGIVVLPPSVRAAFKLPALLTFTPDGRGNFIVSDSTESTSADLEVSLP